MTAENQTSFQTDAGQANGYLVRPKPGAREGAPAGVVVIQEWWGLVPHIKDVAGRVAQQGYVALAPDLYHGKSTLDKEEAAHLMSNLDWGRASKELAGAVRHLRETEGCTKIGVVGFCMGGALTVIAAAQGGVDGYASFYGFPPAQAADIDRITVPGLIFFGENEDKFPTATAQAFAARQQQKGVATEVIVYPDAGHAFFNNDRPQVYREAAATDAWRRTLDLFERTLCG